MFLALLAAGSIWLAAGALPAGFEQHIRTAPDDSTRLVLTLDYVAQTNDVEELRILQNIWLEFDREGCTAHFAQLLRDNPQAPEFYYLWARTVEQEGFQLTAGRKLIKDHPASEYGYRMLLTYYLNGLFATPGPNHPDAQPYRKDYNKDKKHFKTYLNRFPNSEIALYMELQRLVWENDVSNANLMAARALRLDVSWLNWQFYTDFYLRTGQFELLQAYIRRMIDNTEVFKHVSPDEKERYFEEDYFMTLIVGRVYEEAVKFFETHPSLFGRSALRMEYLRACTLMGWVDKAFTLIDNELAVSSDWYDWLTSDEDLSALRYDPRWQLRIDRFRQIRDARH